VAKKLIITLIVTGGLLVAINMIMVKNATSHYGKTDSLYGGKKFPGQLRTVFDIPKAESWTKAKGTCHIITQAAKMFQMDYGRLPVSATDQGKADKLIEGNEMESFLAALTGLNKELNPRGIEYIDMDQTTDPWGNSYLAILDTDYNNTISFNGQNIRGQIVIWSKGANGVDEKGGGDDPVSLK